MGWRRRDYKKRKRKIIKPISADSTREITCIAYQRPDLQLIIEGGELATSLYGNWWNNAISIDFDG